MGTVTTKRHVRRAPQASVGRRVGDAWLIVVIFALLIVAAAVQLSPDLRGNTDARGAIVLQCSLVLVGLFIARALAGPVHPASALAFVTYSQLVLFVARPLHQAVIADAFNPFTTRTYSPFLLQASALAGVGFISICAGFGWALRRSTNSFPLAEIARARVELSRRARQAVGVSVVIGFLLYAVYILQVGPNQYVEGLLGGRSSITKSAMASASAYLYAGLQFATGSLIFLLLAERLRGKRSAQVLIVFLIVIAMLPDILGGNRSVFIPIAIALALVAYTTNPRVFAPLRVLVGLPIVFLLGITAPRIWRDQLAIGGSIGDSIAGAIDPGKAFTGFVGGLDTAMVDAFEVQIAALHSGSLSWQYGSTYVSALTGVIPRDIWEEKPETVDQMLNGNLFPVTDAQGIGFSFGVYSEPYLNFGVVGVLLIAFVFGLTLGWLTNRAAQEPTLVKTFVLIMVIAYIFPLMRGSLTFDSQRLFIAMLPALLALWLAGYFRRPNPHYRDGRRRRWHS